MSKWLIGLGVVQAVVLYVWLIAYCVANGAYDGLMIIVVIGSFACIMGGLVMQDS